MNACCWTRSAKHVVAGNAVKPRPRHQTRPSLSAQGHSRSRWTCLHGPALHLERARKLTPAPSTWPASAREIDSPPSGATRPGQRSRRTSFDGCDRRLARSTNTLGQRLVAALATRRDNVSMMCCAGGSAATGGYPTAGRASARSCCCGARLRRPRARGSHATTGANRRIEPTRRSGCHGTIAEKPRAP